MTLPICYIVDVGHGNASVLHDTNGVLIVDTGNKQKLLQFLLSNNITHIDHIIISHADSDHSAGLIDLLLEKSLIINSVYLNSDSSQNSETWKDIRLALTEARKTAGTRVVPAIHTGVSSEINIGVITTSILTPDEFTVLSGIGGKDKHGKEIDRHSLNAIICFEFEGRKLILLGDINNNGLDNLEMEGIKLTADAIVFPHHGGKPGASDPIFFTKRVCDLTDPSHIIFSVASMRANHPRSDIVEYINDNFSEIIMWSTGEAKPIQDLLDAYDSCQHKSGAKSIKISFSNASAIVGPVT